MKTLKTFESFLGGEKKENCDLVLNVLRKFIEEFRKNRDTSKSIYKFINGSYELENGDVLTINNDYTAEINSDEIEISKSCYKEIKKLHKIVQDIGFDIEKEELESKDLLNGKDIKEYVEDTFNEIYKGKSDVDNLDLWYKPGWGKSVCAVNKTNTICVFKDKVNIDFHKNVYTINIDWGEVFFKNWEQKIIKMNNY